MPELDRVLWSAGLLAKVPGWLQADRRSRAAFNRAFYRVYRDLPARELRAQAEAALPDFIQPRIQHEAVRRIRAHKRRGDKVILMTGALDFLVDSLRDLVQPFGQHLVECAGNTDPENFGLMSAASWEGIAVQALLDRAALRSGARRVLIAGVDDPASARHPLRVG